MVHIGSLAGSSAGMLWEEHIQFTAPCRASTAATACGAIATSNPGGWASPVTGDAPACVPADADVKTPLARQTDRLTGQILVVAGRSRTGHGDVRA
jgi:hypothetical protein